jgi:hypothetical protein
MYNLDTSIFPLVGAETPYTPQPERKAHVPYQLLLPRTKWMPKEQANTFIQNPSPVNIDTFFDLFLPKNLKIEHE